MNKIPHPPTIKMILLALIMSAGSIFGAPAYFMANLDNTGGAYWTKNNYDFNATPRFIGETSDDRYLMSGLEDSKPWVMKTDAQGNFENIDLDLTLATNNTEYDIYEHIDYEVVVQNFGPAVAAGVTVHFPLPPGMVFSGSIATQGNYDLYYETWNIGSLDIGQTVLLNLELFTLDVNGPKTAYAQVQTANEFDPDSTPGNGTPPDVNEDDEAAVTISPVGQSTTADLELEMIHYPLGQQVFYDGGPLTVKVRNEGPDAATGVSVRLNSNAYSSMVLGVTPSQGTTNIALYSIFSEGNWVVGTLAPGATATLDLNIQFIDQYNTAYIFAQIQASDQTDPDSSPGSDPIAPYNPDEDDEAQLIKFGGGGPPADLELFKTALPTTANLGDEVTFTIDVENNGNYPSTTFVSVKDILPPGLSYVSSSATSGSYNLFEGIWYVGYLAETTYPGAPPELITEATLEIVTLITNIDDPITNFAQIETGYDIDATPGNDTDNTPDEDDEAAATINPGCMGDYFLTSQAEVDAFSCDAVTGNLSISGNNITNLDALQALTFVGGSLFIANNPMLESISGLSSLGSVGFRLDIRNNTVLENVNGLENLMSVGDRLWIYLNAALQNLDGFSGLVTVGDFLGIGDNPQLMNIDGLSALTSIGAQLAIDNCFSLENVDGFTSLTTVGGFLGMNNNNSLTDVDGFSSLQSIGGGLVINNNALLDNLAGFTALTDIQGSLRIWENAALRNIDGLTGVTSIPHFVAIEDNPLLENLDGLSALTTIEQNLIVRSNASLSDCCGLYSLLSSNGVGGFISIENNPAFCSSAAEIIDYCGGTTDYCDSYGAFPWHEWIAGVDFVNIHNPSGKSQYSDFTAQTANVNLGQDYTFTLTVGYSYFTYDEYLRVWIDYNQDGDFTDPFEMVFSRIINAPPDGTPTKVESGPIFMPATAASGPTRMRVSLNRGAYPEPCEVLPFGEVEDYTVNMISTGPLPNLRVANNEIISGGYLICKTNPGETFGFYGGVIHNSGDATAGPFNLYATFSKDDEVSVDDVFWREFEYAGVIANDVVYYNFDNPVPTSLEPGKYYSILQVDSENQVMEGNELDNLEINLVQIGAPDFSISAVNGLPALIPAGQILNFSVDLANLSPFPLPEMTGSLPIKVYLSGDNTFDAGSDLQIGSTELDYDAFSNPPMYMNGTATAFLSAIIPGNTPDGGYYLFTQIGTVCEQTMSNNLSSAFPIEIGGEPAAYCESHGYFPWHEWISKVSINQQLNNNSGKSQYSDFTGLAPANITIGSQVNILIDITYSYFTFQEFLNLWIDFNQNGIFEDDEKWSGGVAAPDPGNNVTVTRGGIFNTPDDALPGPTRMRVSMQRDAYPDPCGVFPFGEVEDYAVMMMEAPDPNALQAPELLMLDARRAGLGVNIDWVTNTDFKNDFFIIERSVDGEAFEPMAEVASQGDSDQALNYQGQDPQPYEGYNYYRVKQVYNDGSFRYSNDASVNFEVDPGDFGLFPNPAKHELFVNLNAFEGKEAWIRIYDSFGRAIFEQRIDEVFEYPHRIDISKYNNGLYYLTVKTDDLRLMTKPFMISRLY